MKSFLLLNVLFLAITTQAYSQTSIINKNSSIVKYYDDYSNKFIYSYSQGEYNRLVTKYFNVLDKKELNKENYEKLNLNLLSKNNKEGELYFVDTISFENNLTFSDVNYTISELLTNSYLKNINENEYGLYYLDVHCTLNLFFNQTLNFKIEVKNDKLIIECKQDLNYYTYEHQAGDLSEVDNDFYNSYLIGVKDKGEKYERFRRDKAYRQLAYISIYAEAKTEVIKYIKDYLISISNQKRLLKLN